MWFSVMEEKEMKNRGSVEWKEKIEEKNKTERKQEKKMKSEVDQKIYRSYNKATGREIK